MIGWEHVPSGAGMLGHAEGGQQAAISGKIGNPPQTRGFFLKLGYKSDQQS